ncbi:MAG: extracellular solute-binding protein [Cyanobacteriota bacterium]|nr:extracellular solute-binding protein [Cyanobacteriota bacterium]
MRRRELFQCLAGGSVAAAFTATGCRRRTDAGAGLRSVEFWTLDLAPRFNGYIRGVIVAWEAQNPGWRVRWTDVPWSSVERKLLAAVFARTSPDLVNLNPPFAANLASKGGLRDLNQVLPADARDSYLPAIWEAGRLGSAQFAIPWYLTARISMVNQRLLQGAGLQGPPVHWAGVPAFAAEVRRRTGRYALFVTAVPDDSAELLEILVQMGVQLLDQQRRAAFDSPAGRRAFAFWTDLYRRGLLPREVVSQGYRRAIELYQSGDLALVASGPDFLRNLQTNAPGVAAVTSPYGPITGEDGTPNVAVMNLVVPKQSAVARQAADFALFLTNPAQQLRFSREARVLPSAPTALRQLQRDWLDEPELGAQERLVRRAQLLSSQTLRQARVLVPAMPGVKRLQAILYTQLQRAMLGEKQSDAALTAAAREWNRYSTARWPTAERAGGE